MKNNDPSFIGKRYGRLEVIDFEKKKKGRGWNWVLRCDCGKIKVIDPASVKSGKTKSCGCYHDECAKARATKYVYLVHENKRLYMIYNHMKSRCYNEKNKRYKDYGGRGIKICDEWLNDKTGFDSFAEWAIANGYNDNMTIDRVDVNGDYEPSNCEWKTKKEQNANKRLTLWVEYRGERIQLSKLCEKLGVSYDNVHNRIYELGWDVERAIEEPSQQENSFSKKCREVGLPEHVVRDRIKKLGWSEEEAFNTPVSDPKSAFALATRRRSDRICKICGKTFHPNNGKQIYCGEECRNISKKQKKK